MDTVELISMTVAPVLMIADLSNVTEVQFKMGLLLLLLVLFICTEHVTAVLAFDLLGLTLFGVGMNVSE